MSVPTSLEIETKGIFFFIVLCVYIYYLFHQCNVAYMNANIFQIQF